MCVCVCVCVGQRGSLDGDDDDDDGGGGGGDDGDGDASRAVDGNWSRDEQKKKVPPIIHSAEKSCGFSSACCLCWFWFRAGTGASPQSRPDTLCIPTTGTFHSGIT